MYGSTGVISEGCDLPAYQKGQHVSLDPDRSPLAAGHPARVWIAMLHTLESELQPVMKWMDERAHTGEGKPIGRDRLEPSTSMTALASYPHPHPPSLSARPHRSSASLPRAPCPLRAPYSSEYVKETDVLGGAKSWVGEARKLKARTALEATMPLTGRPMPPTPFWWRRSEMVRSTGWRIWSCRRPGRRTITSILFPDRATHRRTHHGPWAVLLRANTR